ncbi:hypothetical protein EVAR_48104_1 [Eumeta japonica]|uniref:Uncharacterized protein n=1 Tax=Eumeta variegata TaxID=151549 RepID=A0A4C1XNN9_EUMVA|nr:hypothetical protein EVAR_48104_1 [Eumeta japonica]
MARRRRLLPLDLIRRRTPRISGDPVVSAIRLSDRVKFPSSFRSPEVPQHHLDDDPATLFCQIECNLNHADRPYSGCVRRIQTNSTGTERPPRARPSEQVQIRRSALPKEKTLSDRTCRPVQVLRQTTLPIVPTRHQTFQRQLSHRLDPPTVQFSICSLERADSSIGLIKFHPVETKFISTPTLVIEWELVKEGFGSSPAQILRQRKKSSEVLIEQVLKLYFYWDVRKIDQTVLSTCGGSCAHTQVSETCGTSSLCNLTSAITTEYCARPEQG